MFCFMTTKASPILPSSRATPSQCHYHVVGRRQSSQSQSSPPSRTRRPRRRQRRRSPSSSSSSSSSSSQRQLWSRCRGLWWTSAQAVPVSQVGRSRNSNAHHGKNNVVVVVKWGNAANLVGIWMWHGQRLLALGATLCARLWRGY